MMNIPCNHPGCRSHVSHPCEECGRKWGNVRPVTKEEIFSNIRAKAEAILRREVMEANCLNFAELADKMADQIINLCDIGVEYL